MIGLIEGMIGLIVCIIGLIECMIFLIEGMIGLIECMIGLIDTHFLLFSLGNDHKLATAKPVITRCPTPYLHTFQKLATATTSRHPHANAY